MTHRDLYPLQWWVNSACLTVILSQLIGLFSGCTKAHVKGEEFRSSNQGGVTFAPRQNLNPEVLEAMMRDFESGLIPIPCGEYDDSTFNGPEIYRKYSKFYGWDEYIRYSTTHRLDLVSVHPDSQIIPLALGNYWRYTPSTLRGDTIGDGTLKYTFPGESRDRVRMNRLLRYLPDSLGDTATLPVVRIINVGGNDSLKSYTISSCLGVRKWYISTIKKPYTTFMLRYPNTDTIVYSSTQYAYSSDPVGIVIGRLSMPVELSKALHRSDTIILLTIIPNKPHRAYTCGQSSSWQKPRIVQSPAGVFYGYPRCFEPYIDTTYFVPGVGIVRVADNNIYSDQIDIAVLELVEYHTQ